MKRRENKSHSIVLRLKFTGEALNCGSCLKFKGWKISFNKILAILNFVLRNLIDWLVSNKEGAHLELLGETLPKLKIIFAVKNLKIFETKN